MLKWCDTVQMRRITIALLSSIQTQTAQMPGVSRYLESYLFIKSALGSQSTEKYQIQLIFLKPLIFDSLYSHSINSMTEAAVSRAAALFS